MLRQFASKKSIVVRLVAITLLVSFQSVSPETVPVQQGALGAAPADAYTKDRADKEINEHRQKHRDNFHPIRKAMPVYTIARGISTKLLLINMFSDPFSVRITAFSPKGEAFDLGSHLLEPTTHFEMSLNGALATAGSKFVDGSIAIEYQGEGELLEAWAVIAKGNQTTEIKFSEGESESSQLVGFWDTRSFPRNSDVVPSYWLLNASAYSLTYTVTTREGNERERKQSRTLAPYARDVVSPQGAHGTIVVEHDGRPGEMLGAGLLEGGSFLTQLPVVDASTIDATEFHSVRVPIKSASGGRMQALLSAFNRTKGKQTLKCSIYDPKDGSEVFKDTITVDSDSVRTFDLAASLEAAGVLDRPRSAVLGLGNFQCQ